MNIPSQAITSSISPTTALYGVIGSPVSHSLSPFIFNFLFREMGIDAVYLAFEELDVEALIKAMRTLQIKGFSITLPHKEQAVAYTDELVPLARALGAINTAVYKNGVITGYNFDGLAALKGLERQLPNWRERNLLILGAGGSARGIALTLAQDTEFKKSIGIAARDEGKGKALVSEIGRAGNTAEYVPLRELQQVLPEKMKGMKLNHHYEIVIQTTPLGMYRTQPTQSTESIANANDPLPMKIENLTKNTFVYDIIYRPRRTQFLQLAAAQGMQTLSGLDMFLEQAIMQFEVFAEQSLPDTVRADLYKRLLKKLAD